MMILASFTTGLLGVIFVLLCILLILAVLIQKPKGGGLSGAFGGAGGGQQAVFGSRVGDVLTWATVIIFTLMLLVAIVLVYAGRADAEKTGLVKDQATQQNDTEGKTGAEVDPTKSGVPVDGNDSADTSSTDSGTNTGTSGDTPDQPAAPSGDTPAK